ncbi:hypothetical protein B0T10DRAFT_610802 [Thelonectria olida]|uniref:BZIP domain-containing protein n=1 Tax=Thelonectria olida TaxID=1576542 RepID=A0A9P8VR93_9HYPO|nr:hypothetical protein B0T10DRAFT_610802 [Thelonectria olida]
MDFISPVYPSNFDDFSPFFNSGGTDDEFAYGLGEVSPYDFDQTLSIFKSSDGFGLQFSQHLGSDSIWGSSVASAQDDAHFWNQDITTAATNVPEPCMNASRPPKADNGTPPSETTTPPKRSHKRQSPRRKDSAGNATRERNRLSATRCREKRKKHIMELETAVSQLDARRSSMQTECTKLKEQVDLIKDQLMAHAHCNHDEIDEWIRHEAKRFVKREILA